MFLKNLLAKPNLISFYKLENRYYALNEQYKKNTLIYSETKEFENKKDLEKYIKETSEENPQTYISTFITSQNQGAVPSCNKQKYKELGIEIDNVKLTCVNNKYSFYTTIYELMETKKAYPFADFIYPAFALIDINTTIRTNVLYILPTKEYSYILIYSDKIPVFSDIFENVEETIEEEVEEFDDIDIVEDFDDTLDENIENIEDIDDNEEENSIENLDMEYKVFNHIKDALKEYYENGGDFIEKIFIFDTIGLQENITDTIKDEIFIEAKLEKIDILKTLNTISRKNV